MTTPGRYFYGFLPPHLRLPFKAAPPPHQAVKATVQVRGLHPQRRYGRALSPGNTDPLRCLGVTPSPIFLRLLTSPRGPCHPRYPLCPLPRHCHPTSTAPAGLSSPSSLPALTFCPFWVARVLFSLPWPLCFVSSRSTPAKAPVPSTISQHQAIGEGLG